MLDEYRQKIFGDLSPKRFQKPDIPGDANLDPKEPSPKSGLSNPFTSYRSRFEEFQMSRGHLKPEANEPEKKKVGAEGSKVSLSDEYDAKFYSRKLNSLFRPRVMDAYYNRRIFSVHGQYHAIRRALFQRGWIEKLVPGRYDSIQKLNDETLLTYARPDNNFEAVAINKIIGDLPAFFVWQFRKQPFFHAEVQPYRNVIRRNRNLDFSTKVGLIGCAENEHWFCNDACQMSYPRFYRLGAQDEDRSDFIEDFHCTQCHNLLRFVQERVKKPQDLIDRDRGSIPFGVYKKAVELTRKILEKRELLMSEEQWTEFLDQSNKVIRDGAKFKVSVRDFKTYNSTLDDLFKQLHEHYPNFKWDGYRNIWILKPGYWCRGCGIVLKDNLAEILEYCHLNSSRRYIVQKYIERPLLIYNTKFDFRVYMIVSFGAETISIWLYRDCYFKLSSQQYNLDDLRESIHLTNNSVQKNYENDKSRDVKLPHCNMWSLIQFKQYLNAQGVKPDSLWEERILPGIKKTLIAVVLASMEETEITPNCFELYGCDFMMDEDYNPILIEINATPDLSPSTEVTARLCPMVLKDLVRVIVDVPLNKNASTGLFDLAYQMNYHFNPNYPSNDINVSGKAMTIHKIQQSKTTKAVARKNNVFATHFMTIQKLPNTPANAFKPLPKVQSPAKMKSQTSLKSNSSLLSKRKKKNKKFVDPSSAVLQKKIRDIHKGLSDRRHLRKQASVKSKD